MTTEAETIEAAPVDETVVEAPATEAATETTEAESTETEGESETKEPLRDEKGKFKGVQARIDELTRARREAERSADYWKGIATRLPAQSSAENAAKPSADQYDDYDSYIEALTDWKVEQKTRDVAVKSAQGAEQMHRQATWSDRQEVAKSKLPDYDAVVGKSDAQVAEHVGAALMDSDRGPELAYHLARNPEFLAQLNSMSQTRAALELGRLETELDAAPAPKPVSKAPAPISPITTGTNVRIDLSKASMDDYIAERRKQGANF